MIEPRLEDLVQREVDRQTTPEESRALQELAERRADVSAYLERIRGVSRQLEAMEPIEPPPDLMEEVMRTVRRTPHAPPVGWLETLRLALRPTTLRYAGAFAGGIALGALVVALAGTSPLSRNDRPALSGTMLPGDRRAGLATVDHARLEVEGVRADALARAGGGLVEVELQLASDRAVDVSLGFDGRTLSPVSFERSRPGDDDVRLGADQVQLRHVGQGRYVFRLETREASPSVLRLKLGGVTEITLDTRQGP
jgi:hypothetical protein